jgi:hypothetical protein
METSRKFLYRYTAIFKSKNPSLLLNPDSSLHFPPRFFNET